MQPERELLQINAYADGEMDLQDLLAFEERLRTDAALRARVDEVRRLSSGIREDAQYHAAPASLNEFVAHAMPTAGAPRQRPWREVLSRWLAWRPLVPALALAVVASVVVNVALVRTSADERLDDALVASHVRATLSDRLVDVVSSDHHTVKPWLSARLDFSPPVRELSVPGSTFVGGRVDYIDGRRVAVLVYKQGQHVVDHYIWPVDAPDRSPQMTMVKGFRIAQWTQAGMTHRLVSDVNAAELDAIVQDCRRAVAGS
jgi:anti-sigma factor RsiW